MVSQIIKALKVEKSKLNGGNKMKIKCIEAYYDMKLKKNININDILDVDDARGAELTTKNNKAGRVLAVVIEQATTPTTEKVVKAAPKKKTTKKSAKKDV